MSAPAGVWNRDWSETRDETLLKQVRAGQTEAYAELWRRHLPSAYSVASLYRGRASVEDIVGEASLRIYDRIRAGKGPTSNFRSYFLTTVKSVAIDLGRSDLRLVPTEPEALEASGPVVHPDSPALRVDQDLVRVAFGRLSEFDQQVLWRTAVEGVSPAVIGTMMGMSANRVSVAAFRARDALRAHYLDAHADRAVERAKSDECRWVLARMGRYVRGKLRSRQRARVDEHLKGCRHAHVLVMELTEINRGLPALVVPLTFVAGTSTLAIWATVGLAAGYGGGTGPQPPLSDPSIATVASAHTATTAVVAKAAAVVAAGAISVGLVPARSQGVDASSGGTQLQAAGLVPRTEPRTVAGGAGVSGLGFAMFAEPGKPAAEPMAERTAAGANGTVAGAAEVGLEPLLVDVSQSAVVATVLTTSPTAVAATPASKADSDAAVAAEQSSTLPSAPAPTSTEPTITEPTDAEPTTTEPTPTASAPETVTT
ncbi:MAG: sigma-70 family RNA polymerase sigma factor, partial [Dermatophilaceae bacterium]